MADWFDERMPGQENDDETGYDEWRRNYVGEEEEDNEEDN